MEVNDKVRKTREVKPKSEVELKYRKAALDFQHKPSQANQSLLLAASRELMADFLGITADKLA